MLAEAGHCDDSAADAAAAADDDDIDDADAADYRLYRAFEPQLLPPHFTSFAGSVQLEWLSLQVWFIFGLCFERRSPYCCRMRSRAPIPLPLRQQRLLKTQVRG